MSITRTRQDFKGFASDVQKCTSDEKAFFQNAEELEKAEARASFNKKRQLRARARDLALGVFVRYYEGVSV